MFTVAHAVDVSRVRVGWAAQWWLIGLFYGVSIFLLWGSLEEDSYIFFRVADNLAHGAGYVFNRGGERVETGSSPVWQGLLTLGSGLSVSLYGWAKGLGAAAAALALWQARALERVFLPRSSLMLAPWLLVTSITFLFWSQSGMETGLFAALVLTWARCLLDPAWHRHTGWVGVLLYVCRPEGFLYWSAWPLALCCIPTCRVGAWRHGAVLFCGAVLFHVLRGWYFDDIFPSAFYAKSAFYPVPHWQLYQTWLMQSAVYWLLPMAALAVLDRRGVVLTGMLFAGCYFAAGNPDGKILFRLGLPAISLACVMAAIGGQRLCQWLSRYGVGVSRVALACLLLFLLSWGSRQLTFEEWVFYQRQKNPLHEAALRFRAAPVAYWRDTLAMMKDPVRIGVCSRAPVATCDDAFSYNVPAAIAHWLRDNLQAGSMVAGDQMGEIPWRSGSALMHLDLFGIADRCIGYANFSDNVQKVQGLWFYRDVLQAIKQGPVCDRAEAIERVFQLSPDVWLLGTVFDTFAPASFYGRLVSDPRFVSQYELRYLIDLTGRVYVKKTLPAFSVPATALLVDAASGRILNCPSPERLQRYVQRRFSASAESEATWRALQARCQPGASAASSALTINAR